eukprot:TRINITY_DN10724_c0_g1_i1.p1 TRINITY_DN10724_c0_g1~~TRINITY_DN10724_c0_g1_i1.p1  ORF type:complete len:141 (+),score=18.83 TRINITY_DN10724_c0_g1_i1:72-494(+)
MQCDDRSPIVYYDLVDSTDSSVCSLEGDQLFSKGMEYFLRFGSELKHPFHPDQLFVSSDGKIYHSYQRREVLNPHIPKAVAQHTIEQEDEPDPIMGLLDSTLTQKLLSVIDSKTSSSSGQETTIMTLKYQGKDYQLKSIK